MPTIKLPDNDDWFKNTPCSDPGHEPSKFIVYEPGSYEHTCPSCGKKTYFEVPKIRWVI